MDSEPIKIASEPGGDVQPLLDATAAGQIEPMQFFAIACNVCRANPENMERFLDGLGQMEDTRFSGSVPLIREQLKIGPDGRHSDPGEMEISGWEHSDEIFARSTQPWENVSSELDKFFTEACQRLVELYSHRGHCAFLVVSLWADSNRLFLWEHPESMDLNSEGKGDLLDWCLTMQSITERSIQLESELKEDRATNVLGEELWQLLRESVQRVSAAGALDGLDPKPRFIGMVHAYYHAAFDLLSGEKLEMPLD